jgi:FlaG/FlaF family flagellin (archaellin)
MSAMGEWRDERAATSTVGIVLIVAITVILGGVIGVFAFGAVDDLGKKPTFASLGLTFEEEPVSEPNYTDCKVNTPAFSRVMKPTYCYISTDSHTA